MQDVSYTASKYMTDKNGCTYPLAKQGRPGYNNLLLRFPLTGARNIQFQGGRIRKPMRFAVGVSLQQMSCLRIQQSDSAAGQISCGASGIKCEADFDTGLVVVCDRLLTGARCDLDSGEWVIFPFHRISFAFL